MKRPQIHPAWLVVALFAGILIGILTEQLVLSDRNSNGNPAFVERPSFPDTAAAHPSSNSEKTDTTAITQETSDFWNASGPLETSESLETSASEPSETSRPPEASEPLKASGPSEISGPSETSGPPESSEPSETSSPSEIFPETEGTTKKESEIAPERQTGEWNANQVYYGGDLVLYNGKYYKAKWWTQNEQPGRADVWEDTLEAPPQTQGSKDSRQDSSGSEPALPETKSDTDASLPVSGNGQDDGFRIVAYYPSWYSGSTYSGSSVSDRVQFDKITHLIYAFAIPQSDGTLRPLENADAAKELIRTCHSYGIKVMIAVGGWSYNGVPLEQTFVTATETPEKIRIFADEIISLCEKYGFDGVDMDWEHPRVDGNSSAQYEDLMLLLAERLHADGKLLTSAVLSGATADGNIYYDAAAHTDAVLNAVDWINVMAYDGGDGERHSGYDFAVNCGRYWKETRGVSADKIILGVPFYGRPGWAAYSDILAQNSGALETDVSVYNGMESHYNGAETLKKKTLYAKEELGGIMIWEVTQDTADREKSLLNAIYDAAAGK